MEVFQHSNTPTLQHSNTPILQYSIRKNMEHTQAVILVVDDNPANLGLLFDLLDEAGFEVLVSQSGESAIKRAKTTRPDIILLDVMMPGIDGFETCRRLKANVTTQDIPIIFMTAVTETDEKVKGFDLGAVDYVTKPVQPREVLARVNTHLTIQRLQRDLKASLNREKDQERQKTVFVSTTSNIIGTLMNTITFSLNLLKQNNEHMTHEERLRAFSKIEASLQKARQKVDELLEKEGERL